MCVSPKFFHHKQGISFNHSSQDAHLSYEGCLCTLFIKWIPRASIKFSINLLPWIHQYKIVSVHKVTLWLCWKLFFQGAPHFENQDYSNIGWDAIVFYYHGDLYKDHCSQSHQIWKKVMIWSLENELKIVNLKHNITKCLKIR